MNIQELSNDAAKKKMEKDFEKLRAFLHSGLFAGLSMVEVLFDKEDVNVLINKEYDTFRSSFWNEKSSGFKVIEKKVFQRYVDVETKMFYDNVMKFQKKKNNEKK